MFEIFGLWKVNAFTFKILKLDKSKTKEVTLYKNIFFFSNKLFIFITPYLSFVIL